MQPFESLTPRGQIRRLRHVVAAALEQYDDVGDERASLVKQGFNTTFGVVAADGRRAALRVGARERIHPEGTEVVETAWIVALRADTDLDPPLPIANRSGAFVTRAGAPGVPEVRTCVLFEWARGRRLSTTMTVAYARACGRLMARLHEHGAQFDGGRKQPVLVGDRALGFVLADLIPRADPTHGTMLADALDRAQAVIDDLWARPPQPPHILHSDLHPNNIIVSRGRLTPIDFQDLIWGFEIQDVAVTITAFWHYPDAEQLATAFRAGYEQLRPWPASDTVLLATLVAARHLSVLNLGYNLHRPGYDAFVERHTAWLREWMERG